MGIVGMDDRVLPAVDTAGLLQNMEWDNTGAWQTVGGTQDITTFSAGAITQLCWFNPRGGQRWLVAERRVDAQTSEIVYADWQSTGGNRGRAVRILTRRRLDSVQLGTQFREYNGWLYMLSPLDGLVRWNGFRTAQVGFVRQASAPRVAGPDQGFDKRDKSGSVWVLGTASVPTSERGVGPKPSGSDVRWLYGYAITTINDLGQESPPSTVVYASGTNPTADGSKRLVRVLLPRQKRGIRGVRLWRTRNVAGLSTPGSAVEMTLLEEFGSSAPCEYIDSTPDQELGVRMLNRDATGTTPFGARAMAFWASICWLGGMPDDTCTLAYSTPLLVEQFPAINRLPIGTSATGPIVALMPMMRGLLVFKTGGIYLVKMDASTGIPRVETLTEREGCAAPQAIEQVPGVGVLFLSTAGPRLLVGSLNDEQPTTVVPTGLPIASFWRRKVGPNLLGSRSMYDPERGEVWFAVPEGGDPDPVNGVVFHTATRQWSVRTGWNIGAMVHYRGRTFLGSWSTSGIHVLTRAVRTRFGASATGVIATAPLVAPDAQHLHRIEIRCIAYGSANTDLIDVATRTDKRAWTDQQLGKTTNRAKEDREKWGTALWSTSSSWTEYELDELPASIRAEVGRYYEARLTVGARARILDVAFLLGDTAGPAPRERA